MLSRKKDERIVINGNITIVVVEIRGDKVRLGFDAPKEVAVHRQEVFDSIQRGEPSAKVKSLAKQEHESPQDDRALAKYDSRPYKRIDD